MGLFHRKRAKDSTPAAQAAPEKPAATAAPARSKPQPPDEGKAAGENKGREAEDRIYSVLVELQKELRDAGQGESEIYRNLLLLKSKVKGHHSREIDLLFRTKKAIFVIESKDRGKYRDAFITLTYNEDNEEESVFQTAYNNTQSVPIKGKDNHNPVFQNQNHRLDLEKYYLTDIQIPVISVICFSDRCTLEKISVPPRVAYITRTQNLKDLLRGLIAADNYYPCGSESEEMRIDSILKEMDKKSKEWKEALNREQLCDKCGSKMNLEVNHTTLQFYYDCTKCKKTKSIP